MQGLSTGLNSSIVPIYIKEFSPTNMSGILGSFNQIFICIGAFVTVLLGLIVDRNNVNHQQLALMFPLLTCCLRIGMMSFRFDFDSPVSYLSRGKTEEAKQVLSYVYRGIYIDSELK